jgi:hypothetical protein
MRWFRFSVRRLLLLTAVVAVLLYCLYLRPPLVAKQYAADLKTVAAANLQSASNEYFDGVPAQDGSTLEISNYARRWRDVWACQQRFTIRLVTPSQPNQFIVANRDLVATPLGIKDSNKIYLEVREVRQK